MTFAEARALQRAIADAALMVAAEESVQPKAVVVTRAQQGALLAVLSGSRLPTKLGFLAVVCDEDIGAPLPGGQWQIVEFIPKKPTNQIARDVVGDVLVSTIDLAAKLPEEDVGTCFPPGEPRYETHVSSDEDGAERRYVTREEALAGHAAAVSRVTRAALTAP